ncbi:MAG: hypothetical protein NUV91_00020, partial [Candidatus Omnitrophica bacterium]|nr:hypothetical protein [Candidatus Omnitrophota bacterium]
MRVFSSFIAFVFLSSMMSPPMVMSQGLTALPQPGTKITLSAPYQPLVIKGVTINPEDPMTFDFIIDIGDSGLEGEALEAETQKLVKYFLTALTVPDDQLWVNLSPYERDLMVPDALGITEMGKDMLAQDYLLKQILASLTDPQDTIGKQFWQKVYDKANRLFGTTDVPVNMFNKVWVVPEQAYILEQQDRAFVAEAKLKMMLEEDFLALKKNLNNPSIGTNIEQKKVEDINNISLSVIQEVIIPELQREVNEGKNFAQIRQVYYSVVLATWFKENLKESILGKLYVDKNKVAGVDVDDKSVRLKIYDQYMAALRQGVYDMIKEDYDPASQMVLKRRYFSGGFNLDTTKAMIRTTESRQLPQPARVQAQATVKAVASG